MSEFQVEGLYMVRQIWRNGKPFDGSIEFALCDAPYSLMFLGSDVGGETFEYEIVSKVHLVEVIEDDEA